MNIDITMGRIHVCSANVSPCDDPENQMVVSARLSHLDSGPLVFCTDQPPQVSFLLLRDHMDVLYLTVTVGLLPNLWRSDVVSREV